MTRIEVPPSVDGTPESPRSPLRTLLFGAVVVVVVVAAILLVVRSVAFPIFEGTSEATRAEATARARLGALQTQQALTATGRPTAAAAAATGVPATVVATPQPIVNPAPTSVAQATSTVPPSTAATARPTVPPELDAEIAEAYLRYFQVRSDALLALDPSGLDEVAADGELEALKKDIEEDRSQGRALKTEVQHRFVVLSVAGSRAQVADRYLDSSLYVDPATQEPLPGQVAPASPEVAPEIRVIYELVWIDGRWKVIGGERHV